MDMHALMDLMERRHLCVVDPNIVKKHNAKGLAMLGGTFVSMFALPCLGMMVSQLVGEGYVEAVKIAGLMASVMFTPLLMFKSRDMMNMAKKLDHASQATKVSALTTLRMLQKIEPNALWASIKSEVDSNAYTQEWTSMLEGALNGFFFELAVQEDPEVLIEEVDMDDARTLNNKESFHI